MARRSYEPLNTQTFDVEYRHNETQWKHTTSHKTEAEARDAAATLIIKEQLRSGCCRIRNMSTGQTHTIVWDETPQPTFKQSDEANVNIVFDDGRAHQFGPLDKVVASQLYDLVRQNPKCGWGIQSIELNTRRAAVLDNPEGKP